MKDKWIVSKCLLGIPCRYDGRADSNKATKIFIQLIDAGSVAVCPEELGGLPTPRPPAEIQDGDGAKVFTNSAIVKNAEGKDVTDHFMAGAQKTLEIANNNKIKKAILKSRSPSCGCGQIYDGSFSGNIAMGDGVTTALLKKNHIKVISDEDFIRGKRDI